jgi:hypothetical protein
MTCLSYAQHTEAVFTRSAEVLDPYRNGYFIDYAGLVVDADKINRIVRDLETDRDLTEENYLAYHCLAYNLNVIQRVLEDYPIQSIKQLHGIADEVFEVGGVLYTYESLEEHLLDKYNHGAIHFLLVDGSLNSSGLPIHSTIKSEQQYLDNLLSSVLNNRLYAYVNLKSETIALSNIFKSNAEDFGGVDRIVGLIELANTINLDGFKVKFDGYDYALNDIQNAQQIRFIPDRILTNGEYEIRLIENYYTQSADNPISDINTRTSALTHWLNVIIGSRRNYNIGFVAKARSITVDGSNGVFNYLNGIHIRNRSISTFNGVASYQRVALTAIGPQLRYRPNWKLRGNSQMVHTLMIPTGDFLEGTSNRGFIDWDGFSLYNQWLYNYDITTKTNLFYDIGLHIENIDGRVFNGTGGNVNISTPVTLIYHYYPAPKWTLLTIATLGPRIALKNNNEFEVEFNPFGQVGVGLRRYLSYSVEAEIILTQFFNDSLRDNAQMINLGFRYTVQ